jgi:hypothetical protein
MPDDDVDDAAELIAAPLNVDLNAPADVADTDEGQDDSGDQPEPKRFDGSDSEPDTGFSAGH